jgi:hypothetical protein
VVKALCLFEEKTRFSSPVLVGMANFGICVEVWRERACLVCAYRCLFGQMLYCRIGRFASNGTSRSKFTRR